MQQPNDSSARNSSGEIPAYRSRSTDIPIPSDAPPEKIRQQVRAQVEDGLRNVCGNWPTGEFDRIVADVTATAMKYHGRERRKQEIASGASGEHIAMGPQTTAASLVHSAAESVQKFLQLETLPFR